MEIRRLTETYAVSPQIEASDIPELKAAGFTTVICNRPDPEVSPSLQARAISDAVKAAGMEFVEIPVLPGGWEEEVVAQQAAALDRADGPVLAYCASGTRSTIVWMFGAAATTAPDALLSAARAQGYELEAMRPQLDRVHAQGDAKA